jgi:hypothetical protein
MTVEGKYFTKAGKGPLNWRSRQNHYKVGCIRSRRDFFPLVKFKAAAHRDYSMRISKEAGLFVILPVA